MKKYLYLAALLIAYNCCAMELAKLSFEDDKKCFLVARYLHTYPQGKKEDEKNKIDLFFSSEKTADKKNKKFSLYIDDYRNKIHSKESFLFVATCKELPVDVQKIIFNNIRRIVKRDFIHKITAIFKSLFHGEAGFLATEINLKRDFENIMREDLLKLLNGSKDECLLLCNNYVNHSQYNPIHQIDCTRIIGQFNTADKEHQNFLDILLDAQANKKINNLYDQFILYLSKDKFFQSMFSTRNGDVAHCYYIV